MIIKGKKVYLKKGVSDKEYSNIVSWYQDISVIKFFKFAKQLVDLKTVKEAKELFKDSKDAIMFGIFSNKSKKMIGYIVLADFKKSQCELGMAIGDKEHWGKGIGYEVMKLIKGYSFKKLGLEKIYLTTSEYNKRAIRLYKKVGFKVIKRIPREREVYHNKKWVKSDTICMELKK